jgi:S-adenosylmethionine-diacylglycerol 3-amino-3-carboxypropyl transferase
MMRKYIFSALFIAVHTHAEVSDYALHASTRPIAFSVVREDSLQDLEIIKRYFPEERVSMLMVASGGCTAAQLAARAPLNDLTLVDPNAAQLALSQLKIQLLSLPVQRRLEILGYLPMNPIERKTIIQGYMQALHIDLDSFANIDGSITTGLDFAGRYEEVFEALRLHLAPYREQLESLFLLTDIEEQVYSVAPGSSLGDALDEALDVVMSQENLVSIFGEKATANRVQDFSRHFAERIRTYLAHHLASSSPWLANMLLGHFHNDVMFPWLTTLSSQPLPSIAYYHGYMNDALAYCTPCRYDVIHLSNIIDWLSPEEAEVTLNLAHRALKPGGVVIIRQLNSNLDIPQLGNQFEWNIKASKEFLNNDRSFFYRNFFIGFKHKDSSAPRVKQLADEMLAEMPVIEGTFFQDLSTMDKAIFQKAQAQFFFAVDYFSRPMAALIARLPLHKDRIDIIHNIVEEHGDFSSKRYHSNTFRQFLSTIDVASEHMDQLQPSAVVTMFNYTLMGACAHEDPVIAIACNGIIEYAFADISALIAKQVVERGWVSQDDLVHYNLHADIDKQHAEEFFKIVEPSLDDPVQKAKVVAGLRLGAYIFNRLYTDLYQEAKDQTEVKEPHHTQK